jgi:hypothetical protein
MCVLCAYIKRSEGEKRREEKRRDKGRGELLTSQEQ